MPKKSTIKNAAFQRTKEMTKQVRRIVENVNRKRQREINKGNIKESDVKKLYASEIWEDIMNADNPKSNWNAFIGSEEKPGALRIMQGRYKENWKKDFDKEGNYNIHGIKEGVKILNRFKNVDRESKDTYAKQVVRKRLEKSPKMNDDEYEGVVNAIAKSRSNTNKENLPDVDNIDYNEYYKGYVLEASAKKKAQNYLLVLESLEYLPKHPEISEYISDMFKYYPKFAQNLFNHPDPESDADWVYDEYMKIIHEIQDALKEVYYDKNGVPHNWTKVTEKQDKLTEFSDRLLDYWEEKWVEADTGE